MSPFHTTEPQTWINKNYPSQACEKLMRVQRHEEKWGPRRVGPVHKGLPNFRILNILAPAPCYSSRWGCEITDAIFYLLKSTHSLKAAIQACHRGHRCTNTTSGILAMIPTYFCAELDYEQKSLSWIPHQPQTLITWGKLRKCNYTGIRWEK